MAVQITVPELGESVVEATVGEWLKSVGDTVAIGDVLVELQTDKVDLEVNADVAGILIQIDKTEDEDVGSLLEQARQEAHGIADVDSTVGVTIPASEGLEHRSQVDVSMVEGRWEAHAVDHNVVRHRKHAAKAVSPG